MIRCSIILALLTTWSFQTFAQNWTLEWSDEFSGTVLNSADWNYDIGTGSQFGLNGWGNNEEQYYRSQNVSVSGGYLRIEAFDDGFGGKPYTSGKIHTKTKQTFSSGKIEARIQVPVDQGMWPAFWLLTDPGNLTQNTAMWPPEIDVFECVGSAPSTAYGTIHAGEQATGVISNGGTYTLAGETLADDFHVYAVEWYNDNFIFSMDGIVYHTINRVEMGFTDANWQFDNDDWFIILNLAVGGNWPGSPNGSTQFPAEMLVDYVRVYSYDPATTSDVTFRVDMTDENLQGGDVVYLSGTFNNWCGGCDAMTNTGNGIWETTVALPPGITEFKYQVNQWNSTETLSAADPCTVNYGDEFTNRYVNVGFEDIDMGLVCYSACSTCSGYSGANCDDPLADNYNPSATFNDGTCLYTVTINVDMTCEPPASYNTVFLVGPETNWCGNCTPMSDSDGDDIWTVVLQRGSGTFEYKYAHDNWAGQENLIDDMAAGATCAPVTDFATYANRRIDIPGDGLSFNDAYNTCTPCASNTGCTDSGACNFDPDASSDDGSCEYISCAGCTNALACNFDASATIDNGTCQLPDGCTNAVACNYNAGASCDDGSCILPDGCTDANACNFDPTATCDDGSCEFTSCAGCTDPLANNYSASNTVDDGSCMYTVSFALNMQTMVGQFTTPEVNGTFNSWCGATCSPMSDADGDGVWTVDISIPAGVHEFKFAADNWNIEEDLSNTAGGCTLTTPPFTNRTLDIPSQLSIGPVCWELCEDCPSTPPVSVTFRVDMSNEIVHPDGVHLAGDFNGWDPFANPMVHLGYGIYETTADLPAGENSSFLFLNGNALGISDELVPPACATDNYRTIVPLLAETVSVCFAACEGCAGCTDPLFMEYNPFATTDDGSCSVAYAAGCTYLGATNYNPLALLDDGSCLFDDGNADCPSDLDGNGSVGTSDLLAILGDFGVFCP